MEATAGDAVVCPSCGAELTVVETIFNTFSVDRRTGEYGSNACLQLTTHVWTLVCQSESCDWEKELPTDCMVNDVVTKDDLV